MCRDATFGWVMVPLLLGIAGVLFVLQDRAMRELKDGVPANTTDIWRPSRWTALFTPEGLRWWRRFNRWGAALVLGFMGVAVFWLITCGIKA